MNDSNHFARSAMPFLNPVSNTSWKAGVRRVAQAISAMVTWLPTMKLLPFKCAFKVLTSVLTALTMAEKALGSTLDGS